MLRISVVNYTSTSHNCFHFRESVNKPFTIELGDHQFHLCAEHAEQLADYLKEKLESERQDAPVEGHSV